MKRKIVLESGSRNPWKAAFQRLAMRHLVAGGRSRDDRGSGEPSGTGRPQDRVHTDLIIT